MTTRAREAVASLSRVTTRQEARPTLTLPTRRALSKIEGLARGKPHSMSEFQTRTIISCYEFCWFLVVSRGWLVVSYICHSSAGFMDFIVSCK